MTTHKPVAPYYAVAITWLVYACFFPLYAPMHYVLMAVASGVVFFVTGLFCKSEPRTEEKTAAAPAAEKKEPESTGDPEVDKMLKDGALALAELKRLDANIADPGISADIVRMEQISGKIFELVKENPKKLPQIRRFMDYYLPTTLKLLNAYDRASSAGISGENVDATKAKVEGMTRTVVAAFEKQLDALFGDEALDISTDITVLETMMAREGLTGESLKADAAQPAPADDGIRLEL